MNTQEVMDAINRKAWKTKDSVTWFSKLEGWTDPGERVATERLAEEMKDQRILDIGVGGGRTVPLLRAVSRDYTAIDYTPELVDACKKRFPDVNVSFGDARDLSRFADGSFAVVAFSFNGIDAVNPKDRMQVLREAYRVLRKGGVFFFSVHNVYGPGNNERLRFGVYFTRNPFKLAIRVLRALRGAALTVYNYRRYSRLREQGEGYAISNASAHNHGIVVHYISLEKQLAQLAEVGFLPNPEVYGSVDGERVRPGDDTRKVWWFHFLARK